MSPVTLIITLALFAILLSLVRNYFRLPRTFDGPFLACISNEWLASKSFSGSLVDTQLELLPKDRSGVVRMAPNMLLTNDPELLRHMSLPKSRWTRSEFHDANDFGGKTKNIFAERDEKRHAMLRSKLGLSYSGKGVDFLESSIDDQVRGLVRLLRDEYAQPKIALDLTRVASFFTLDVLSSIAFGKAFGFMTENADKWEYLASNDTFFRIIQLVCNYRPLREIFLSSVVQRFAAPKETNEVGFGRMSRFAADIIRARFEQTAEKDDGQGDMLASFMARGLSLEECKSESLVQVIAGSDSTSSTIRMTMLYIISSPRIYLRLQREIDETVPHFTDQDEVPSESLARQLPYLQAVIWEGLRKTPPLFGLLGKVAPPEGERVGDVFFPGGCEVSGCLQSVTHREDIFGEDANLFRPERWLEADSRTRYKYERTTELVFGSGRFGCLGRNIAWMELGKVLFELLRRFDWQIVDPVRPVKTHKSHSLWVQRGMDMVVTERN